MDDFIRYFRDGLLESLKFFGNDVSIRLKFDSTKIKDTITSDLISKLEAKFPKCVTELNLPDDKAIRFRITGQHKEVSDFILKLLNTNQKTFEQETQKSSQGSTSLSSATANGNGNHNSHKR